MFLTASVLLYFAGELIAGGLMRMSRLLRLKEFVVAFFVMAFAASLPNFFLGTTAALHGIPELSFGDVAGNNLVTLTLAVALAIFIGKRELPTGNKTVQSTALFTAVIAMLPLILTFDGTLSRADGIILIGFFAFYFLWLFAKRERFSQIYNNPPITQTGFIETLKVIAIDGLKIITGIALLLLATYGIVRSAEYFALQLAIPLMFIGILVTGLANALPETYLAITLARKGETDMILGNLMGAVIVPATLVLGAVALIHPFIIADLDAFAIARFFLFFAAGLFFISVKTGKSITRREATGLLAIYAVFVMVEILFKLN